MRHEPALQHPAQALQPMQFPPFVDAHHPVPVDPHDHATSIALARLVADGILVAGAVRGVFDAVEDVGEGRAEGFLVFFGQPMGADGGEIGERVQ